MDGAKAGVDGAKAGAWYDPDRNPFKRPAEPERTRGAGPSESWGGISEGIARPRGPQ